MHPDRSRLREFAQRFSLSRVYTDYRDLLADSQLDAVSIVTMWDQHAEPVIAALESGKHVFVEKPMASTAAECDEIVNAAARSSAACMVGHICRFNPRYAAAQAGDRGRSDRQDCFPVRTTQHTRSRQQNCPYKDRTDPRRWRP